MERLRDGATSRAEVTIPAQVPDVEFSGGTAGGGATNVEHGVGYVGGAITRTVFAQQ